ncbi:MAG TPA: two-component regulator propeller domain-containing protein [Isosphaeraceae bacterium]|jgi:diguanylate cyclase (GGDEF)-like protein|nr:two-component regulator propeller domain-containing protein [Isosphaeraceae bacterium]
MATAVAWLTLADGIGAARADGRDQPGLPPVLVKHWQLDDGLPQAHIQAIAQTSDGYLWVGTLNEGPARFDGVRFTALRDLDPSYARHSHRDQVVNALLATPDGALWIGTEGGGLCRWRDGMSTFFGRAEGLPDARVRCLAAGAEGTVWVGTAAGLVRLREGAPVHIDDCRRRVAAPVTALLEGRDRTLWVGTERGLYRLRGEQTTLLTPSDGLSHPYIKSFVEGRRGDLWVGTQFGLNHLVDGLWTSFGIDQGLVRPDVLSLHEDAAGWLWIGTVEGLYVRDPAGGRIAPHRAPVALARRGVLAIVGDHEGDLWLGSQFGLFQLRERKLTVLGAAEGLLDLTVNTVGAGRGEDLWVSTGSGGVARYRDGRFEPLSTTERLSSEYTTALLVDRAGALWVGTWGHGLNRVADGRCTIFRAGATDGEAVDIIRSVFEDRRGTIWIGTWGAGLRRLKDGKFTTFTTRDGLVHDRVRAIAEDPAGALWVATHGGLNRLKDGRFTAFTTRDGLGADSVFSLLIDADGTVWVGTWGGGLSRIRDGRVATIRARDGLHSDTITQVLDDGRGGLWMGSPRGIFRVARAELEDCAEGRTRAIIPLVFDREDGLESSQCSSGSQPAGCRGRDGRLWFPTVAGLVGVDPRRAAEPGPAPPTVIEEVRADGRPIALRADRRLPVGHGDLSFRFTANTFVDPEKVRFRYKLEGYDADWIDAGARRVANYTNLPPGSYRFTVRACNAGGTWSRDGATLAVELVPRFEQTAAFHLLCILGLVGAGGALGLCRAKDLRRHERQLRDQVDARTAELRREVAERRRAEHELRDKSDRLAAMHATLAAQNRRLAELAVTDGLTGLKNRRYFHESLESTLALAARIGTPTSVVLLDVDHFKSFNDTFGHLAGDEVLRGVGVALRANVRDHDVVARYGGEEFIILLPATAAADALAITERLRADVAGRPWPHRAITASFGVATACPGLSHPSELIDAADRALYRSKRLGRDRVTHHDDFTAVGPLATALT